MGISYGAMTAPVRTGVERATLVRRTYLLVLGGVGMTVVGCMLAMLNPTPGQTFAACKRCWVMLRFRPHKFIHM